VIPGPRREPGHGLPGILPAVLLLYTAMFILRPWEYKPELAFFPWERACGLLMIVVVLALGRPGNGWSRVSTTMALFLGGVVLATVLSPDVPRSWHTTQNTLKTAIFGLCLAWGILSRRDLRTFVRGWIVIAFVYQAKSLWEHLVHGRGVYRMGIWRLVGIDDTYSDPNTFAASTVLLIPFVWEMAEESRSRAWKAFLLGELLLSVVVVLKTGSRGGLLALIAVSTWILWRSRRHWLTVAVVTVLGALVVWFTLSAQLILRYETILHPELNRSAAASAEGRIAGLKRGLAIVERRPLAGIGPGCFTVADRYLSNLPGIPGLQAHNLLGQALGETGLVGFVPFLLFLGTLLARARRLASEAEDPLTAGVARAVLVSTLLLVLFGAVGHNLYRYNWFWNTGLLEAAGALTRRRPAHPRRPGRRFVFRNRPANIVTGPRRRLPSARVRNVA